MGVGEDAARATREWRGFKAIEDANGLFQVIETMTPLQNHYSAKFLYCERERGFVLHLVIPKTVLNCDRWNRLRPAGEMLGEPLACLR